MEQTVLFLVTYNSPFIAQISNFLSQFDLGINQIDYPVTEKWSWNTKTKIDKQYIKMMKQGIKKALEKQGANLISIRFVK